jgi:hypothetical protein
MARQHNAGDQGVAKFNRPLHSAGLLLLKHAVPAGTAQLCRKHTEESGIVFDH